MKGHDIRIPQIPAVFIGVFPAIMVFVAQQAVAQPRCALSLVLALDVSSSVDDEEFALQTRGLAAALRDPAVRRSISAAGGIQATAFEWSGRQQQVDVVPWSLLRFDADIFAFADRIESHQRAYSEFPTALGYALGYAATRLRKAPLGCARSVVDVSGDGINNEGFEPALAYRHFNFSDVTVNGLVIQGADPDPVDYFHTEVIHGPGAFVVVADDFSDYEAAMKRKLLREINGAGFALAD
jgi:Ca-activated chloride channel family protein